MKTLTHNERAALAQADFLAEEIVAAESNRAALWDSEISLTDRQRAVGVAGLTKERAGMPLASFTHAEREQVRIALAQHVARMEFIVQCMAPATTNRNGWLH